MSHLEKMAAAISAGAAVFTILAVGLGLIIRITRRWTQVEDRLTALVDRVTEAIGGMRDENTRLERRIDRNEDRINRHEDWHARGDKLSDVT